MEKQLTTTFAVQSYLDRVSCLPTYHFPEVKKIVPLNGGVNYTFRLFFSDPYNFVDSRGLPATTGTAIFKHAQAHVALTPHVSFDEDRQLSEIQALANVPNFLGADGQMVHLPQVFYQDAESRAFMMEDVSILIPEAVAGRKQRCSISLKDACKPATQYHHDLSLAKQIGVALGRFIALLHSLRPPFTKATCDGFPLKNVGSRVVCAQTAFGEFLESIEGFGIDLPTERKDSLQDIMVEMTERVLHSSECLIMGDFWAGNVIATLMQSPCDSSPSVLALHVIDWEFFTQGAKFVDLGHFAAEAWLYDHFYPPAEGGMSFPRQLAASLFQSYRDNGGACDMLPVVYYIAGHVGCFLGYTQWTQNAEIRKATAMLAVTMIEDAAAGDLTELKRDPFLAALLN